MVWVCIPRTGTQDPLGERAGGLEVLYLRYRTKGLTRLQKISVGQRKEDV